MPSDVLKLTPGLVIGQHHGGGKSDQILFRGFDSDHGTDFAIFIDGIPVNMVSHAHGQGYADMHWLIPETIDRVEIYKGPYFVHLGDFATSGATNIVTKQADKNSLLTLGGGSYNTQRYVGIFAPPENTILRPYVAGEVYHNDGPFKNENNYIRYNILAKLRLLSTANSNLSFLGTFFKTDWDASGEIPARAARRGDIGRFGAFDPSEGGKSQRQNLSLIYNYADANQSFNAQTWAGWYKLRLPGPGSGVGGGGTASIGPVRGTGTPGLYPQGVLRTNREAKPIQTARAVYPAMALRACLESDVTLKIEVDTQGNVTRVEIIKSGGGGFDEEALRAVRQSRFEPAQSNGENIAAEFTYVYRFRLRR